MIKYELKNNTYFQEVKTNPKDRISIEIGDSKQPDFKPQFKVMRWDNEVNFSMRAEEVAGATLVEEGEKIKYITPDYEVHQYDKPQASEEGGFEFEWVLSKKPASNVLAATIQMKGLDFLYQPALPQEEIDKGAFRPENVIGSYAVYHKTKGGMNDVEGMEYKAGKAFHIYRPEAIDANGIKTFCDLNIDELSGILTVIVPQKYLDDAMYPVIIDPTFGYGTAGASTVSLGLDDSAMTSYLLLDNATVTSLVYYFAGQTNDNTKGLIYTDNGTNPTTRQAVGSEVLVSSNATWWTSTISNLSIAPGNWYIGTVCASVGVTSAYDTSTHQNRYHLATSYATPADPWDTAGQDAPSSVRKHSVYANYTKTYSASFIINKLRPAIFTPGHAR